jgi:hypothetical protein
MAMPTPRTVIRSPEGVLATDQRHLRNALLYGYRAGLKSIGRGTIQECRRDLPGELDQRAAIEKEKLVAGVEESIEKRQHQIPKARSRSYRDFMVLAVAIVIVGMVLLIVLR